MMKDRFVRYIASAAILALFPIGGGLFAQDIPDSTVLRLVEAGFMNVRTASTEDFVAYTVECDSYKLPAEGLAEARRIVEQAGISGFRKIKIIGTSYDIPEVTMTYYPRIGQWRTTRRLDESWDAVKYTKKENSSFGKVNILVYPQVSLMNLIITQVYQSLWQLSPAVEVQLLPGMKFTYQMKFPIYNDGYGVLESKVHPGMISLSQRFRDPWHWNISGKMTVGVFSNNRYGAALEMMYYFPNERFSLDTQLGIIGNCYWDGFVLHYNNDRYFRWNVAANYYNPSLQTQFTLRAQRFLYGDYGVKYEMIRHFRHCSVGLYSEKSIKAQLNVGFRFQIALPPYRQKRYGYWPKISTSAQMGMSYNANNEQKYYKEFRTEASDNIMSKNYYNPYYLDYMMK